MTMQKIQYDEPVFFFEGNVPESDSGLVSGKKVYPDLFDLTQIDPDKEYRVGIWDDFIVEITHEGEEVKKKLPDAILAIISEEDGKFKAKPLREGKPFTVSKLFKVDQFDLNLPFLIQTKGKKKSIQPDNAKIFQLGKEIEQYNAREQVGWKIVSHQELSERGNFEFPELYKENHEGTLYRVGVNYDNRELTDDLDLIQLRLPLDTLDALENSKDSIDNFSLNLFKAAEFSDQYDGKKIQSKYDPDVLDRQINYGLSEEELTSIRERLKHQATALCTQVFEPEVGKLEGRMALGLGEAAAYETGILLHHLYGLPYVPASSLKGVVRSFLIQEYFGFEVDSEARAFHEDQGFCDLFGCPNKISFKNKDRKGSLPSFYKASKQYTFEEKMGDILFFDALPTSLPKLKVDIMNPHYGPYYQDGIAPADYHSPVPVFFLTVEDTGFDFFFGLKEDKEIQQGVFSGKKQSEVIKQAIQSALTAHGLGAKTALGYGFFQLPA